MFNRLRETIMKKCGNMQHIAYWKFIDATNFIEKYSMELNSYGLVLKEPG
jgi:hypothetical protein